VNWFHPLIWVQIEAACRTVGWPWKSVAIKQALMRTNPEQFATLYRQRIGEWIEVKGSSFHFTERVQDLIATSKGMEPGGHSSRIGILVSQSVQMLQACLIDHTGTISFCCHTDEKAAKRNS
jgi:hypothetical protein